MFSNRQQVAQVCRILTQGIGSEPMFGPAGPSDAARAFLSNVETRGGDRVLVELAVWLWEGGQAPRFSAVVELVDRTRLRSVGTLIVALSEGSSAIDRWLRANGSAVGQA